MTATKMFKLIPNSCSALALAQTMTPAERAAGRFMRAPDHDAGGAPASSPSPSPTPTATDGTADAGAGAPAAGADAGAPGGSASAAADEGTVLGSPADGAEGEGGDKPQGEGAAVVPEKYELTLPEGVTVDQAMLDEATPVFKKIGLSNEQASELVPVGLKMAEGAAKATVDQIVAAGQAQRKEWLDAAKADTEIGGAKWEESTHNAAKALDAFGFKAGHPFRKALEETGFGNHPDMIRAFAKIGANMVGEDGDFIRTDAASPVDALTALYPNNRRSKA